MSREVGAIILALLLNLTATLAHAQAFSGNIDKFEYHLDETRTLLFDGTLNYGGDQNSALAKLVTNGRIGGKIEQAAGELAYSRAIGIRLNLEVGARQELRSAGHPTYAVVGVFGEPSKGFAVESYALVSRRGNAFGEFKLVYDHSLAQGISVQPRLALNIAGQDVPDQRIASGPVAAELGLRLRFDLTSLVAPYVGISHERLLGGTARLARRAGKNPRSTHIVVGFSSTF